HAMVVPTMLHRVLDVLVERAEGLPGLRHLSYGGGPMPRPVVERALTLLPHVDFVNAYGLTETSSSIAVLGPEDHRAAVTSDNSRVRRRLGSVGRPLPTVEISIRDENAHEVAVGERGIVWVRGPQVSGEYLGRADGASDGWFDTRDAGEMDDDGFLYVFGRQDDVIVRGGENLSPGEIEDVLLRHPAVHEAVVVGVPDVDWGEKVVAAVVLTLGAVVTEDELRDHVRVSLRSARTPERIQFRTTLPTTDTGKVLRREVRSELARLFG
ncbi:MAG: class I adenylate-forming enzyme family protein, partial [Actinomycetota bacterium]